MMAIAFAGCSKSSNEKKSEPAKEPPKEPPTSVDAAAAPAPEAAAVVGPTRSAAGTLELAGAITGTFEWRKKEQRNPITCVWDPAKEIGTVRVDLGDGAGKLITIAVDVPPTEAGSSRLEVTSKDLAAPLKTAFGFNVSGDDPTLITVKFDSKLGDDENKPDLTITGTLEVTCPKRDSK